MDLKFLIARDLRNRPHDTIVIHAQAPIIHARVLDNGDLEAVYTDPAAKPDRIGKVLKSMAKWYNEYRIWEIEQSIKRHAHEGDIVSASGVEYVESNNLDLTQCLQAELGGHIQQINGQWRLILTTDDYKIADWINVKKRIAKLSEDSEAPDMEELTSLAPGNIVKVCAKKEYLTIVVASVTDNKVLGIVQSSPKKTVLHGVSHGDRVTFKKYHIFEIKRPDSKAWE